MSRVGAELGRDLDIIHAVSAQLTESQLALLRADSSVRVYEDRALSTQGTFTCPAAKAEAHRTTVVARAAGEAIRRARVIARTMPPGCRHVHLRIATVSVS